MEKQKFQKTESVSVRILHNIMNSFFSCVDIHIWKGHSCNIVDMHRNFTQPYNLHELRNGILKWICSYDGKWFSIAVLHVTCNFDTSKCVNVLKFFNWHLGAQVYTLQWNSRRHILQHNRGIHICATYGIFATFLVNNKMFNLED